MLQREGRYHRAIGMLRDVSENEDPRLAHPATELRSLDLADPSYVETLTALLD